MLNDQKQAAAAELQSIQAKELAQKQQAWKAYVEKSAHTFREMIPAWKDENVGRKELGDLVSYARTMGYSDQEIQTAADPRALHAMYKAMKFDELQKSSKNLKPVKGKTLAAGSPQRNVSQTKRSDATKRLKQSGSIDDAAALFATLDLG
jgi:hypothetical protein